MVGCFLGWDWGMSVCEDCGGYVDCGGASGRVGDDMYEVGDVLV